MHQKQQISISTKNILFTLLALCLFTGCTPSYKISTITYDINNLSKDYSKNSELKLVNNFVPYDIVVNNKYIIATDTESNCLVIIDRIDNVMQKIGKEGNEKENYLSPSGVCMDKNGLIYIVDSGNRRIKILNSDFTYKCEISLTSISFSNPFSSFDDIAVDDKLNIYLTIATNEKKDANLLFIQNTNSYQSGDVTNYSNSIKTISKEKVGVLSSFEGNVYFTNTYQFYSVNGHEAIGSGEHKILQLVDGDIIKAYRLPQNYTPGGLYVTKDRVYCSSKTFGTIDCFQLQQLSGNPIYDEKIFLTDDNIANIEFSSLYKGNDNIIYFVDKMSQKIIVLDGNEVDKK